MSAEKPLSNINFFVCSTYVDLVAYRDTVIKNVQSHAGVINAQEFFGARDQKPLATCLEELERSDVFVMFLGPRYGSIDPDTGKSFVECEYERAKIKGIPRFAYLIDDSHPFPIQYVSTGEEAEKLRAFKKLVQAELTVDHFTTPDDLAKKVYNDLTRELPKKGFKLGKEEDFTDESTPSALLTQFLALPKLFYGRTTTLTVKLGSYHRASEEACDAFSYRYGATITRRFKPVNEIVRDAIGGALSKIYASEDRALALMNLPGDVEVRVVLKTIQGEHTTRSPIYGYEHEPGLLNSISATYISDRKRVVVDYETTSTLICGLELVEAINVDD